MGAGGVSLEGKAPKGPLFVAVSADLLGEDRGVNRLMANERQVPVSRLGLNRSVERCATSTHWVAFTHVSSWLLISTVRPLLPKPATEAQPGESPSAGAREHAYRQVTWLFTSPPALHIHQHRPCYHTCLFPSLLASMLRSCRGVLEMKLQTLTFLLQVHPFRTSSVSKNSSIKKNNSRPTSKDAAHLKVFEVLQWEECISQLELVAQTKLNHVFNHALPAPYNMAPFLATLFFPLFHKTILRLSVTFFTITRQQTAQLDFTQLAGRSHAKESW